MEQDQLVRDQGPVKARENADRRKVLIKVEAMDVTKAIQGKVILVTGDSGTARIQENLIIYEKIHKKDFF